MRKKRASMIQKHYMFDTEKNCYLIEVSLDDYDDVYDEWDPAPFKKRFIEDEFDDFVVSSSEDIPIKYKLSIVLYLPEIKMDTNKESAVIAAYKNYYGYRIDKIRKSQDKLQKKTFHYLISSIFFLVIGYYFQNGLGNVILNVLKEGVLIGGWVFLWEFFTNLFIKSRDLDIKFNLLKRIYESEIRFIYS